jgi:S-formylglutathione hydrolase FrmB
LQILLAAMVLFPAPAQAAGRVECSTVKSRLLKREVRYCVLLPPSYDTEKTRRYPALYYLHGLFENEQTMVNSGGWNLAELLWEKKRIGEYLIVTPDGGRGFYVNSRDGLRPYEDFFIRELIPAIDAKYRTRATPAQRGVMGVSMGGYGALRFGFKYPQKFASVSAHSAALAERVPKGLLSGPQMMGVRIDIFAGVFGTPLDQAFWDRNNPFTLARQTTNLARLKIYFDCGKEDEYGFEVGAEALSKLLTSRKIPHEFHLYPGGHGWQYVAEHLDASLEFHSRAFGLTPAK